MAGMAVFLVLPNFLQLLVIITACTSIFAIGIMQTDNQNLPAADLALEVALSLIAVVCSWFLTHTVFALHYATCYYRRDPHLPEGGFTGGLDFPGDEEPDYWDFMYFSFTIGMTAQTSDVAIPSVPMRQLAIAHGIVSFSRHRHDSYLPVNVANLLGSGVLMAIGLWGIQVTFKRERQKRKKLTRLRQEMQLPVSAGIGRNSANSLNTSGEDFSKEIIHEFSYETYIENPAQADRDRSGSIDIREAIALAFGLSLNNLGSGIGTGISEFDVTLTTFFTFSFSVLAITGGFIAGYRSSTRLSGLWAGTISGLLTIAIGISEYFVL
jgi:putative Mn2+ efflux pump MntP